MQPLVKDVINIVIVDDSTAERCEVQCGEDWYAAETLALARQRIEERFGSKVHLEYIDLAKSADEPHILELKRRIAEEKTQFPVLVIDGKPRVFGLFDIRILLDTIEVELETRI